MSFSIINEILQTADIVEVISEFINLQKVGKNYKGICTVHNDTAPSLSISQEKQIFKCFSCGISGNVINFLEKFQNMSKKEAILFLTKKYNIDYTNFNEVETQRYNDNQQKIIKVLNDITQKFSYDLTFKENTKVLSFLKSRNLNDEIQNKFSLGYAKPINLENYKLFLLKKNNDLSTMINASLINEKENPTISDRLVFPIKNEFGDIIALSSRTLDPMEKTYKYINSGESSVFNKSKIIYNFWRAKDISKNIYLVEGFMDVIAFSRVGLDNAIALMGTSISDYHVEKLKKYSVSIFLDNDKAGINATIKSINLLLKAKINVNVINNDSAYDPDEYLNHNGQDAFLKLLEKTISGIEFIYQQLLKSIDLNNSNNIKPFLEKLNRYLIFCDSLTQSQYLNKVSQLFNIDVQEINKNLKVKFQDNLREIDVQDNKNKKNIVTNPEKTIKIKGTLIFININRLLLGMLKNPKLIKIYSSKKVFLGTSKYMELAKYIISKNNDVNFQENEVLEKELREIEKTKNPPTSEDEFMETINNIAKDNIKIKLSQNSVKLKQTIDKNPDDNFVTKIIESSVKIKEQK